MNGDLTELFVKLQLSGFGSSRELRQVACTEILFVYQENPSLVSVKHLYTIYKADLFYAEQTATVHIILCEPKCFYWLVVHMHSKLFCVLCTVKANEQKREIKIKTYNKEPGLVS